MKKILGVSPWIWAVGCVVITAATVMLWPGVKRPLGPVPLEIVKQELLSDGNRYSVRGSIHNPRSESARSVTISFEIGKSVSGRHDGKTSIRVGDANAQVRYIAPGQTVEFTAASTMHIAAPTDVLALGEAKITEK